MSFRQKENGRGRGKGKNKSMMCRCTSRQRRGGEDDDTTQDAAVQSKVPLNTWRAEPHHFLLTILTICDLCRLGAGVPVVRATDRLITGDGSLTASTGSALQIRSYFSSTAIILSPCHFKKGTCMQTSEPKVSRVLASKVPFQ